MAKHGSMFRLTITIIVISIVIIYAIFNTRLLFKGPVVEIYDLYDGQVIAGEDLIEIRGTANNISYITLNGRQIFIDENNNFREIMLLTNKINIIEIYAEDKFKKSTTKKIVLIYKEPEDKSLLEADEQKELIKLFEEKLTDGNSTTTSESLSESVENENSTE